MANPRTAPNIALLLVALLAIAGCSTPASLSNLTKETGSNAVALSVALSNLEKKSKETATLRIAAAARLDDLVNFIPARLTALLVPVASLLLGFKVKGSVRIFLRDRHKHSSPNSGQIEAAAAGALGIQLGGLNYYHGKACHYPTIGDPDQPVISGALQTDPIPVSKETSIFVPELSATPRQTCSICRTVRSRTPSAPVSRWS